MSFSPYPLYVTDDGFSASLRAFERGQIDFNGLFPPEVLTYESNIAYTMRFMIDTKVSIPLPIKNWANISEDCRDELGQYSWWTIWSAGRGE